MKKHEHWQFDDYDEFLTTVQEPRTSEQKRAWGQLVSHESGRRSAWHGTDSWEQAIDQATNGWPQGLADMAQDIDALAPFVQAALPQQSETLAPAGYMPNVPAFCAGSPANMWTQGEDFTARTPVLRMLVNIGGLAHVNPRSWIMRGAAIASVVDYFEQTGIQCEIEAVSIARAGASVVEVNIPVKQASQHLDQDRLAFALGSPSMLRRFVFSLREKSTTVASDFRGSYGSTVDAVADADQIYFPKMRDFDSPESALQHVLKNVMKYLEPALQVRMGEDWAGLVGDDSRVA